MNKLLFLDYWDTLNPLNCHCFCNYPFKLKKLLVWYIPLSYIYIILPIRYDISLNPVKFPKISLFIYVCVCV